MAKETFRKLKVVPRVVHTTNKVTLGHMLLEKAII